MHSLSQHPHETLPRQPEGTSHSARSVLASLRALIPQRTVTFTEALRIGRRAIVSFPNFGHWRVRSELMFTGRMPRTETLNYSWYDTPNIHLCTIRDFVQLVNVLGATIDRAVALDRYGAKMRVNAPWWFWNMFGEQAVFLLHRRRD